MRNQTAGDPQSRRKWKRKSLRQLSKQLEPAHPVSPHTVGRLLDEQGYSLHVNHKELDERSSPDRNEQFEYIQAQIQAFLAIPQNSLGHIVQREHFPTTHQILELSIGLFG